MCFSASASFTASGILAVIGAASVKKAKSRTDWMFAAIPLIFSAQQLSEGILWLALRDTGLAHLQKTATFIFIFFAQVVWPIWVPLSISRFEKKGKRKTIFMLLNGIGVAVSIYLAYCLLSFPVLAKITEHHIAYDQQYPAALSNYGGALYVIATIAPPFVSGIKRMWILGLAILVSYIITTIFYTSYIVSVWCFFAAVISIAVLLLVPGIQKKSLQDAPPAA